MSYYFFPVFALGLVILVILIERLLSYIVNQYIENQGWVLLDSRWVGVQPRGYLSRGNPIHKIRYVDKSGNQHNAFLRISLIYGIEIEEDQLINSSKEI